MRVAVVTLIKRREALLVSHFGRVLFIFLGAVVGGWNLAVAVVLLHYTFFCTSHYSSA